MDEFDNDEDNFDSDDLDSDELEFIRSSVRMISAVTTSDSKCHR